MRKRWEQIARLGKGPMPSRPMDQGKLEEPKGLYERTSAEYEKSLGPDILVLSRFVTSWSALRATEASGQQKPRRNQLRCR